MAALGLDPNFTRHPDVDGHRPWCYLADRYRGTGRTTRILVDAAYFAQMLPVQMYRSTRLERKLKEMCFESGIDPKNIVDTRSSNQPPDCKIFVDHLGAE
jgi:hypothetical protein